MKRNRGAQLVVAALFLLLAGAGVARLLRPGEISASTVSPAPAAPVSTSVPAPIPETPAANLAIKLSEALAEQLRRPPPTPDDELAKARERDAAALGKNLKDLLAGDPSLWRSVFDVLDADDPRVSRRIAPMIRDAADEQTERELIGKLHVASRPQTRRLALDLLCGRSTGPSLSAVSEAVRRDPDPGVRYVALMELALRKGSASSPDAVALIDQAIQERSHVDASPEVRQAALRILGQSTEKPPAPPRKSGLRAGKPSSSKEQPALTAPPPGK